MASKHPPKSLSGLGLGKTFTPVKTLTSAVTTAWGVDWDEVFIARDIMQNFFDANRDQLDAVEVTQDGTDVRITAPSPLNLERLFYLGSEKGEEDVGQYGEGFKVAATCLLRDHDVTPIAASGKEVLLLRVADEAVQGTGLYPVEYDFFRTDTELSGTILLLRGCSPKLMKALAAGLNHFFHDKNPLLGAKRWEHYSKAFALYDSTDGQGHVFYRNLKRGDIEGIPVILVISKQYEAIERKIGKDRDRNAFGEQVMKLFYNHFARYGLKGYTNGQRVVVEAARPCWTRGHPLLSEIADFAASRWNGSWPASLTKEVFGDKYFARCSTRDDADRLQFEALEKQWEREGKQRLPEYFKRFGVLNAWQHCQDLKAKALEEAKRQNQRTPTTAEMASIRLLAKILDDLAPEIAAVFARGSTSYTVAQTEALLGQLKQGRGYRSREVFLAAGLFTDEFPRALSVFLHEHAHIFGHDGSRGFSDALTELLETVIRHRTELGEYEQVWHEARKKVERERKQAGKCSELNGQEEWLLEKSADELRQILARVPAVVLKRLRESAEKSA